jgi:GntP family gluconate:H+ symporter
VPFVIIQILMVGTIIAFPGIVSRDKEEKIDLDKVKIEIPMEDTGGASTDLLPGALPGAPGASGAEPAAGDASAAEAQEQQEQKEIDDLFKPKK